MPQRNGVRRYPDYVGRRVRVPSAYFNVRVNEMYRGKCTRWGRYSSISGAYMYGYWVHFEAGDGYWISEEDVHAYIVND